MAGTKKPKHTLKVYLHSHLCLSLVENTLPKLMPPSLQEMISCAPLLALVKLITLMTGKMSIQLLKMPGKVIQTELPIGQTALQNSTQISQVFKALLPPTSMEFYLLSRTISTVKVFARQETSGSSRKLVKDQ